MPDSVSAHSRAINLSPRTFYTKSSYIHEIRAEGFTAVEALMAVLQTSMLVGGPGFLKTMKSMSVSEGGDISPILIVGFSSTFQGSYSKSSTWLFMQVSCTAYFLTAVDSFLAGHVCCHLVNSCIAWSSACGNAFMAQRQNHH